VKARAHGKGKELLYQKNLAWHVICTQVTLQVFQCGTLQNVLFVEHWLNYRHTYLQNTDFFLFYTRICIGGVQVQTIVNYISSERTLVSL
jgi:hypothetical protein